MQNEKSRIERWGKIVEGREIEALNDDVVKKFSLDNSVCKFRETSETVSDLQRTVSNLRKEAAAAVVERDQLSAKINDLVANKDKDMSDQLKVRKAAS